MGYEVISAIQEEKSAKSADTSKSQLGATNLREIPVFDRGSAETILNRAGDWSPPSRQARSLPGVRVTFPSDGPTIADRVKRQAAWATSQRYIPNPDTGTPAARQANDNQDWPLAKALKTDGKNDLLEWAIRYRQIFDAATMPAYLVGREIDDNIYLLHRTEIDESTGRLVHKGVKEVGQKKTPKPANDWHQELKPLAKPVPKKWNGDAPLIDKIDATRELAYLRAWLRGLIDPVEDAVAYGLTMEAIGRALGYGDRGASAAGKALVYAGLEEVGTYFRRRRAG